MGILFILLEKALAYRLIILNSSNNISAGWAVMIAILITGCIFCSLAYYLLKRLKQIHQNQIDGLKLVHNNEIKWMESEFYKRMGHEIESNIISLSERLDTLLQSETDPEKIKAMEEILRRSGNIIYKINHSYHMIRSEEAAGPETEETNTFSYLYDRYLSDGEQEEVPTGNLTKNDEKLLKNAIIFIRKNLENPQTNVEAMSKGLSLSRTHLHRKLKALTGLSPVEFIKAIRMKEAAFLLSTGKYSVSEVSYKVGYNTPSYFSSSFTSHYGMSPTTFIGQASKRPDNNMYENTPSMENQDNLLAFTGYNI